MKDPDLHPLAQTAPQLRRELSSFVGRSHELARVARLLCDAPLVTLAGPGGAGKTRLAMQVARGALTRSSPVPIEDVFVVELAPVADPRQVPRAVAEAVGLRDDARQPLISRLLAALGAGHLLLLDNCEHLVDACAELVETLLRSRAGLRVLATSREPLAVEGEHVFRVPPLGLPSGESFQACASSEAVQLFVQRATAARGEFTLDGATVSKVAHLCRRLGGLPLAIELAAARTSSLSLEDIVDRLDVAGPLLSGGPRSAPARQRTLQATISWSYDLLAEDQRQLFDHLSVFVGGFALDLAEAIGPPAADTAELLSRLVTRSMVQLEPLSDGSARYRLLEPLRQFGRDRLLEQGAHDEMSREHARVMVALVERAGRELEGPRQLDWFQRLDLEWDNVRIAHDWAEAAGDAETGLRLVAPLLLYWARPDRQAEARSRLERVLSVAGGEAYPEVHARVVGILSAVVLQQGDLPAGTLLTAQALTAARAHGDRWLEVNMLRNQGLVQLFGGELAESEQLLSQALELARSSSLRTLEASLLGDLASLAMAHGDLAVAEAHLRTALRLSGLDAWSEAMTFNSLGDLLRVRRDAPDAAAAYARALPTLSAMNGGRPPQGMLHNLGYVELARDNPRAAARLFVESADGYRTVGQDRRGLAECVMGLGGVAVRVGQPQLGARLFGAAEAALQLLGSTMTPANRTDYEQARAELAGALRLDQRQVLEAEGRGLELEHALELARPLAREASAPAPAGTPASELTARELEVAQLLARGLRNRQIAEALVITNKTAANHVQRVLDKLEVRSRAEVAARAEELGLRGGA